MYTRKAHATRETPTCDQGLIKPDAREGQAGRAGVAERLEVPLKPGNAGGGKGPQFKTNATSGRMSSAGASARASAARRASPPDSEAPERPSSLRRYSAR